MLIDLGEFLAEAFAQPLADGWTAVIRRFKPDADEIKAERTAIVTAVITLLCLITGFALLDNGLETAGLALVIAAGVVTAFMITLIVIGKKRRRKS